MIVGGGVTTINSILDIKKAGSRFVVLGTILEQNPNSEFISNLLS